MPLIGSIHILESIREVWFNGSDNTVIRDIQEVANQRPFSTRSKCYLISGLLLILKESFMASRTVNLGRCLSPLANNKHIFGVQNDKK